MIPESARMVEIDLIGLMLLGTIGVLSVRFAYTVGTLIRQWRERKYVAFFPAEDDDDSV